MGDFKYTKQEMRLQKGRLAQLIRYLPTLQLRKSLLRTELIGAQSALESLMENRQREYDKFVESTSLVAQFPTLQIERAARVTHIERGSETIAGIEVPTCGPITFAPFDYDLYDTPPWVDRFVSELRLVQSLTLHLALAKERVDILEQELRTVSIRVNLFEKVLIPRCERTIKSIKIFLEDLQLSAISQAKIAKAKVIARKELLEAS